MELFFVYILLFMKGFAIKAQVQFFLGSMGAVILWKLRPKAVEEFVPSDKKGY